jgi:hypothetical protein
VRTSGNAVDNCVLYATGSLLTHESPFFCRIQIFMRGSGVTKRETCPSGDVFADESLT